MSLNRKKNSKRNSKIPKQTGKGLLITVKEDKPDKTGHIFEFQIHTTAEELFKKEHFRVFKIWMKASVQKLKTLRSEKNREFRLNGLLEKDQKKMIEEGILNPPT